MRLIDADSLFKAMENADWYNNADRDEVAEVLVINAPTITIEERKTGKLPSAQPETHNKRTETHGVCLDAISRQAAIDFIDAGHLCNPNEPRWSDNEVVNFLKSRPSTQPKIIRCKDCKWKNRHNCTRAVELFIDDDKYCAWAERREDGKTT